MVTANAGMCEATTKSVSTHMQTCLLNILQCQKPMMSIVQLSALVYALPKHERFILKQQVQK